MNLNNVTYQIPNWLEGVRLSITALGASHYAVLQAVNSVLGEMKTKGDVTVKNGAISNTKKSGVNASLAAAVKFSSPSTSVQTLMAQWHYKLEQVDKFRSFPEGQAIPLPETFATWIKSKDSFKIVLPSTDVEANKPVVKQ